MREDLTLVDIENDRKALDVALHLDEESVFIKELKRQPFDIGISAEFWVHQNDEDTRNLSEMLGYYLPVFDEIFIFAYGLVGECGNVNSSGLELKGETMPEEMNEVIEVEETEVDEVELAVEEVEDTETSEEVEIAEEETEEEIAEEEEVEEVEAEEVEDEEGEDEEDYDSVLEAVNQRVGELEAEVESLRAHVEALKKDNRRLSAKLQKEKEQKEKFFAKAKGISVKLGVNEDTKPKERVTKMATGDGIGD